MAIENRIQIFFFHVQIVNTEDFRHISCVGVLVLLMAKKSSLNYLEMMQAYKKKIQVSTARV